MTEPERARRETLLLVAVLVAIGAALAFAPTVQDVTGHPLTHAEVGK
jgi:hypothetical protein